MKKVTAILVFLFACASVFAQDVITKKNGEDIRAKVLEVSQDEVKYVEEAKPNGPTYTISKADILLITYPNGTKDIFSDYRTKRQTNTLSETEIAQLTPNMKYSQLKNIYNYKDYDKFVGNEKYDPALMGVCSFLIPGLGQVISGEAGRGILQFLGGEGLVILGTVIANSGVDAYGDMSPGAAWTALGCYAGAIAVDIFSIVDAVRVAKVRNMYKEDLSKYASNLSLSPYYDIVCLNTNTTPIAGFSLRYNF